MIKNQNFSQNNLLTLIFVLLASTTVSSQFLKTSGKDIIDKVLKDPNNLDNLEKIKNEVNNFCSSFPLYKELS